MMCVCVKLCTSWEYETVPDSSGWMGLGKHGGGMRRGEEGKEEEERER